MCFQAAVHAIQGAYFASNAAARVCQPLSEARQRANASPHSGCSLIQAMNSSLSSCLHLSNKALSTRNTENTQYRKLTRPYWLRRIAPASPWHSAFFIRCLDQRKCREVVADKKSSMSLEVGLHDRVLYRHFVKPGLSRVADMRRPLRARYAAAVSLVQVCTFAIFRLAAIFAFDQLSA